MQVKTKVTEERVIDVSLPYFKKKNENYGWEYYIGILNEQTCITITKNENHVSILSAVPSNMDHQIRESFSWDIITEEEFLQAHEATLKSLFLTPELMDETPNLFQSPALKTE